MMWITGRPASRDAHEQLRRLLQSRLDADELHDAFAIGLLAVDQHERAIGDRGGVGGHPGQFAKRWAGHALSPPCCLLAAECSGTRTARLSSQGRKRRGRLARSVRVPHLRSARSSDPGARAGPRLYRQYAGSFLRLVTDPVCGSPPRVESAALDGPVVIDLAEIVADSAIAPAKGKADHLPLDGAIDRAVCAFVAFAYQPVLRRAAKRSCPAAGTRSRQCTHCSAARPIADRRTSANVPTRAFGGVRGGEREQRGHERNAQRGGNAGDGSHGTDSPDLRRKPGWEWRLVVDAGVGASGWDVCG